MSQQFIVVSRKNLQKPEEAPKFYALARSMRSVTLDEICARISERSSFSLGELEGVIGEFLLETKNVLAEGCIAQIGKLGNFRLGLKTGTPAAKADDFRSANIKGSRVLFNPSTQLKNLCKTMKYSIYKNAEAGTEPAAPQG